MSRSNDPGHFFQSTSALEASERKAAKSKNKKGDPTVLPSKILAVLADATLGNEGSIFVAESAGTARWLDLKSADTSEDKKQANDARKKQKIYRGPTAPLTSLALSTDRNILYAGCWDKCVWAWDVSSTQQIKKFTGHADFVKSVLCVASPGRFSDILISGSADASVILWSASTGGKLHVIRGTERARGILDLMIEPELLHSVADNSFILYAGCSDPPIRRWRISISTTETDQTKPQIQVNEETQILVHDTSVNAIAFGATPDTEDDLTFDIFTASSDKTAKRLSPQRKSSTTAYSAAATFSTQATMPHPDFVGAVLVSHADGTFATGCRDGDVRVFDAEDQGNALPLHTFIGHYEDVTGLALVEGIGLVSVSIDGTVRRWGGISRAELSQAAEAARAEAAAHQDGKDVEEGPPRQKIELTAEEEAELAELMSDDE